jgi:1-acyl-sn-glycerol-3-phosphate acyltransferase
MQTVWIALRSALFMAAVVLITPPYALLAWMVAPLPARARYRIVTTWSYLVIALARSICGIRYRVEGAIRKSAGPFVVLANHQSAWETLAFQLLFPAQVLVLKRGLLWVPFFGWGLATLSPITVQRGAGPKNLRRLLAQGGDRLAQGFWVVVFPEGTRTRLDERRRFQVGGAWLASRTGVPVLPVAHNAGGLWPRNRFMKYPGTITVSVGAPIASVGREASEINEEARRWVEAERARIGDPCAR